MTFAEMLDGNDVKPGIDAFYTMIAVTPLLIADRKGTSPVV